MKEVKDVCGATVHVGSVITYPVRKSTEVVMRVAVVREIKERRRPYRLTPDPLLVVEHLKMKPDGKLWELENLDRLTVTFWTEAGILDYWCRTAEAATKAGTIRYDVQAVMLSEPVSNQDGEIAQP